MIQAREIKFNELSFLQSFFLGMRLHVTAELVILAIGFPDCPKYLPFYFTNKCSLYFRESEYSQFPTLIEYYIPTQVIHQTNRQYKIVNLKTLLTQ